MQATENGTTLTLLIDEKGRFIAHADDGSVERVFCSQPIVFTNSCSFLVIANNPPKGLSIYVNAQMLPEENNANPPFTIETVVQQASVHEFAFPEIEPSKGSNGVEVFFLESLLDVQRKIDKADSYNLAKLAEILYQLLIDNSLIARVNQKYQFPLKIYSF